MCSVDENLFDISLFEVTQLIILIEYETAALKFIFQLLITEVR